MRFSAFAINALMAQAHVKYRMFGANPWPVNDRGNSTITPSKGVVFVLPVVFQLCSFYDHREPEQEKYVDIGSFGIRVLPHWDQQAPDGPPRL